MEGDIQTESLPSVKLTSKMEEAGVARSGRRWTMVLALAILAGVFIALGGAGAAAVMPGLPAGAGRLLGGLVFCLGLVAIVATGAELFMGEPLTLVAFTSGRVKLGRLLGLWALAFLGNALGALLVAGVLFLAKWYTQSGGGVGASILVLAEGKCSLGFVPALLLGILGGVLVGLAMWLCSSVRSFGGKVLALLFPITVLVAAGFEYSIANLFWIPLGLCVKYLVPATAQFWTGLSATPDAVPNLTWVNFLLNNLLPVTLGNLAGGAGLIGLAYWYLNVRPHRVVAVKKEKRAPHILVVDDDPDFVEVTSMILDKEGFQVSTAYNGKEAWQLMQQQRPDMALLDVMMSTTLEGVDLARRMAADPKLKDIPIIMISSIDSTYHAGKLPDSIPLPIDAWLSKPVNPEVLLKTIRRFLA
jgi:formate transporter